MKKSVIGVVAAAGLASSAMAQAINPWGVSVFTGANLGKSSERFTGSTTGSVYTRGLVYSNTFNIGAGLRANSEVIYSGVLTGGIQARGNVTLNGGSISGGVASGGSLKATTGNTSVSGGAVLAGTNQAGNRVTVSGGVTTGMAYASGIDFAAMEHAYRAASGLAADLGPNAVAVLNGNTLMLSSSGAGTNIYEVTAAQLAAAQHVIVTGEVGSTTVLNVIGDSVNIATSSWSYFGGASASTTVINADAAYSVHATGTLGATILAPDALVRLTNTQVHGSVFAFGVVGSGNLDGGFMGVVPTPGAFAFVGVGGLVAMRRRR